MNKVCIFLLCCVAFSNGTFFDTDSSQNYESRHENIMNDKIHGQYSYVDPLGSLIVVKYSTNLDGSNYSEKRQVTANYKKSAFRENNKLEDSITEMDGFDVKSSFNTILDKASDFMPSGAVGKFSKFVSDRYEKTGKVVGNLFCVYLSSMNERVRNSEEQLIARVFNTSFKYFVGVEEKSTSSNDLTSMFTDDATESSTEETSPEPEESYDDPDQIYTDMWSLLQVYSHEAFCKEIKPDVDIKTDNLEIKEDSRSTFESGFDRADAPDPNVALNIVSDLKPMINSTVVRMMKLITSATPADDESLMGNILAQMQPFITPRLSKYDFSPQELNLKLDEINGAIRAGIFEQIHNYRLSKQQLPQAEPKTLDSVLWSSQDFSEQSKYQAQDQKWQPAESIHPSESAPRGFPSPPSNRVKPPSSYTYTYQRTG